MSYVGASGELGWITDSVENSLYWGADVTGIRRETVLKGWGEKFKTNDKIQLKDNNQRYSKMETLLHPASSKTPTSVSIRDPALFAEWWDFEHSHATNATLASFYRAQISAGVPDIAKQLATQIRSAKVIASPPISTYSVIPATSTLVPKPKPKSECKVWIQFGSLVGREQIVLDELNKRVNLWGPSTVTFSFLKKGKSSLLTCYVFETTQLAPIDQIKELTPYEFERIRNDSGMVTVYLHSSRSVNILVGCRRCKYVNSR